MSSRVKRVKMSFGKRKRYTVLRCRYKFVKSVPKIKLQIFYFMKMSWVSSFVKQTLHHQALVISMSHIFWRVKRVERQRGKMMTKRMRMLFNKACLKITPLKSMKFQYRLFLGQALLMQNSIPKHFFFFFVRYLAQDTSFFCRSRPLIPPASLWLYSLLFWK